MPAMPHIRARISIDTDGDIIEFIRACQKETDDYVVEDFSGTRRVSARSMLGMMYAVAEFDELYLVNLSDDGSIPHRFDDFRMLKEDE